jgi:D-3-phosphoglycerate dehydrogenase
MLTLRSRVLRSFGQRLLSSAEVAALEQLLVDAKARAVAETDAHDAQSPRVDRDRFQIQTFNAISPVGLAALPCESFALTGTSATANDAVDVDEPHVILLRSYALQPEEVAPTVRVVARCGAGTNNVPIDALTARGIPVFNTPGANANSVKELVVCALLIASRGVVEGIAHVPTIVADHTSGAGDMDHIAIAKQIETDKAMFAGRELAGKTLALCGLGAIGSLVAHAAIALGMNVVGYDPELSIDAAWRLPSAVTKAAGIADAVSGADFVSIHMPFIDKSVAEGGTRHAFSADVINAMAPSAHLLNFSRADIVDGAALRAKWETEAAEAARGKYICDFSDAALIGHERFVCIPHLGASTEEAEDNCALMAAQQVVDFLETGSILCSVNFPKSVLARQRKGTARLCIVNENAPGALAGITTQLAEEKFNVAQQFNRSRADIAYTVVDFWVRDSDEENVRIEGVQAALMENPAVISTRLIHTGHSTHGPSHFRTREL